MERPASLPHWQRWLAVGEVIRSSRLAAIYRRLGLWLIPAGGCGWALITLASALAPGFPVWLRGSLNAMSVAVAVAGVVTLTAGHLLAEIVDRIERTPEIEQAKQLLAESYVELINGARHEALRVPRPYGRSHQ